MITYGTPNADQYAQFLQLTWEDGQEYWENTLRLMQMTWEQFEHIFRTRGEVHAIYQEGKLAGFLLDRAS